MHLNILFLEKTLAACGRIHPTGTCHRRKDNRSGPWQRTRRTLEHPVIQVLISVELPGVSRTGVRGLLAPFTSAVWTRPSGILTPWIRIIITGIQVSEVTVTVTVALAP